MERKLQKRDLKAENFDCIYCALHGEIGVVADHLIWYEHEEKAMPVCEHCREILVQEENFFMTFSYN